MTASITSFATTVASPLGVTHIEQIFLTEYTCSGLELLLIHVESGAKNSRNAACRLRNE